MAKSTPPKPKEDPQHHDPLKLIAKDLEDLQILAAHLQDSLLPLVSMTYDPEEKTFTALANRFCWEHEPIQHEGKSLYHRVHTGLHFRHVSKVLHKGFKRHGPVRTLNLLTIHGEKKGAIHLVFSGGHEIRLEIDDLHMHMADLGQAWPTRKRPKHIHEHLEKVG